uniref:Uncharacterized protein n=1 Tax=Lepeophtheirus salmonis TaxID=72036 RepID=A0A0K2UR06_LEPSM
MNINYFVEEGVSRPQRNLRHWKLGIYTGWSTMPYFQDHPKVFDQQIRGGWILVEGDVAANSPDLNQLNYYLWNAVER